MPAATEPETRTLQATVWLTYTKPAEADYENIETLQEDISGALWMKLDNLPTSLEVEAKWIERGTL